MAEAQASFTSLDLGAIMKFLFLQGKSAKDIHTDVTNTGGEVSFLLLCPWAGYCGLANIHKKDEPGYLTSHGSVYHRTVLC